MLQKALKYIRKEQIILSKVEDLLTNFQGITMNFEVMDLQIIQEGCANYEFISTKDISIIFNYRVKKRAIGLRIGIDLIEKQSEIILFRTFHDDLEDELKYTEEGIYQSTLTLPKAFLKTGAYIISIAVGIHNVRWIIHDTINMEINISNIGGINRFYSDSRPGLIMPRVVWNTKRVK